MMTNQEMTIPMLGIVKAMNARAVPAPGKDNSGTAVLFCMGIL